MLTVHDVGPNGEVVKKAVHVSRARARNSVRGATTGEVIFAPHDHGWIRETKTGRQCRFENAQASLEHLRGVSGDLNAFAAQLIRHAGHGGSVARQDDATLGARPPPHVGTDAGRVTLHHGR